MLVGRASRALATFSLKIAKFATVPIHPSKKLVINAYSPLVISCLPSHEADDHCAFLSDDSGFVLENVSVFSQPSTSNPTKLAQIRLPAQRDVDIFQNSRAASSFADYEGSEANIESLGPLTLKKLKFSNLRIKCAADVRCDGYIHGNMTIETPGSIRVNNIVGEDCELTFGGPSCHVQSAYCENMTLKALPPAGTPDFLEQNPLNIHFGTLRGRADIEVEEAANTNIGSFEGALRIRQRLGNVVIHLAGECPLIEIDVAEGDVLLSLPVSSDGLPQISGCFDLTAPKIELDKDSLPTDSLDTWEVTELPGLQGFYGTFGKPDPDAQPMWMARTLRGMIRISGSSWADAMIRNLNSQNKT